MLAKVSLNPSSSTLSSETQNVPDLVKEEQAMEEEPPSQGGMFGTETGIKGEGRREEVEMKGEEILNDHSFQEDLARLIME